MSALGNIQFTDSANTRCFFESSQVPANGTFIQLVSTFAVDANCPFFRIFGAQVANPNPFLSTYTFTRGGSILSQQSIGWGTDATYNANGPGLNMVPYLGQDNLVFHSTYAAGCVIIGQFSINFGTLFGFCSRWTAMADSLKIVTKQIAPYAPVNVKTEIIHGVIQAPW